MGKLFGILFWLFAALYLLALVGFVGTIFGVFQFGSLMGSLLAPIGMPWMLFADRLPRMTVLGFGLSFWAALLAPLINLFILYLLKRTAARMSG